MTRIADEAASAAWKAYLECTETTGIYPGMKAAIAAALPHLTEGATPAIDRDDVNDAIGEVWPWDDSDEQARDLRSDVVDRMLALIGGAR
jgi:hypothetical protein